MFCPFILAVFCLVTLIQSAVAAGTSYANEAEMVLKSAGLTFDIALAMRSG
jgi:hypothetical protein